MNPVRNSSPQGDRSVPTKSRRAVSNGMKKLRVAVIMGGPSIEHEVSLKTGRNVLANLDPNKYYGIPVVVSKEGEWDILPEHLPKHADVVFVAMHGDYGEDGTVQLELERVGLPYTCSRPSQSALGMNKYLSLRHLQDAGIPVPYTTHVHKSQWIMDQNRVLADINLYITPPYVLKPNRGGSSLHTIFAEDEIVLRAAMTKLFEKYDDLIVQPLVRGTEVTCGVLDHGTPGSAYPLPPTEIVPRLSYFFDYDSKYQEGGADELTPARLPEGILIYIRRIARDAHELLGCCGMSRADMIVDSEGIPYVLEVNTIPGLTKTSLLPKAAAAMGITFPMLLDKVISSTLASR